MRLICKRANEHLKAGQSVILLQLLAELVHVPKQFGWQPDPFNFLGLSIIDCLYKNVLLSFDLMS